MTRVEAWRSALQGVLALDMVMAKQDAEGRWRNEHPCRGKLWADVDAPGTPASG